MHARRFTCYYWLYDSWLLARVLNELSEKGLRKEKEGHGRLSYEAAGQMDQLKGHNVNHQVIKSIDTDHLEDDLLSAYCFTDSVRSEKVWHSLIT
jgi:hypothetical protein